MPVWHEATRELVRQGKLVVIGITQEQHADRCRLFAQWKGFDWPILHDPINVLESSAVPIIVAIDEHGIVRLRNARPETLQHDFVEKQFPKGQKEDALSPVEIDLDQLRTLAGEKNSADAWRAYGDGLTLWGKTDQELQQAIVAYQQVVKKAPRDGRGYFRLGVCLRMRYESTQRRSGDFQAAIDQWSAALAINPNQYIWRRRIEQYGPLSTKPYPFYDWVAQAAGEIQARGEKPIELSVVPSGAELARPRKRFPKEATAKKSPDAQGRITRDIRQLITAEVTVVPKQVTPGRSARVHVVLRPNAMLKAHWNNESAPLQLWIDEPKGWRVDRQLLESEITTELAAESDEPRHLEFEVAVPRNAKRKQTLTAYALYYVCDDVDGTCLFLRRDITIEIDVK